MCTNTTHIHKHLHTHTHIHTRTQTRKLVTGTFMCEGALKKRIRKGFTNTSNTTLGRQHTVRNHHSLFAEQLCHSQRPASPRKAGSTCRLQREDSPSKRQNTTHGHPLSSSTPVASIMTSAHSNAQQRMKMKQAYVC